MRRSRISMMMNPNTVISLLAGACSGCRPLRVSQGRSRAWLRWPRAATAPEGIQLPFGRRSDHTMPRSSALGTIRSTGDFHPKNRWRKVGGALRNSRNIRAYFLFAGIPCQERYQSRLRPKWPPSGPLSRTSHRSAVLKPCMRGRYEPAAAPLAARCCCCSARWPAASAAPSDPAAPSIAGSTA